ncbi:SpoIIE family protein phosphatase [Vibrio sp. ZSDZ34]|uniref:SpoIIE family protein phosphatase n=1 Tax=Vibrio gelatinilyticus TaxID=2893468 RepID=A0A9X1W9T2_9VIBR|nr:SpoIIE family protein phosphatase [Vibrio gelatinilyticus]MCJ2375233.1 SpoIIE family protein phosphatase [Vibrio gelatinilyticus]
MAKDSPRENDLDRTILLVEDNRTTQILIKSLLTKRGYNVLTASHGQEAIRILNANSTIQFVLSDWVMPEMDGIALCQTLKSQHSNRYIFFVLLSSQDDQASIINGINAGADDFVAKNTAIDELDARIRAGFRTLSLHNELLNKKTQLDLAYQTIRQDLEAASDFIKHLLPSQTELNGVEMTYISMPCTQIGGDMLGYSRLDDDHVGFYLLDVSGHGVSSALLSFSVQHSLAISTGASSLVRKNVNGSGQAVSPIEVVEKLNNLYCQDSKSALYFTMIYALLNTKTGVLTYTVAGHPPFVLYRAKQQTTQLIGRESYVIGMFDFADYQLDTIQLEPGDEVWLYTDGLTEARVDAKMFSEQRLSDEIQACHKLPYQAKTSAIIESLQSWQEKTEFEDDVSLLVAKWTP